ncbi:hypothetical protein [Bradyrhizobium sp. LMTR 3]|uniref:DUF7946 domain-containing protein n=1 Tax=Bradyrhizobium sp. LMTR 3 TaxID=189873 RepID=UPI000810B311|nr:hypothetical protein [Bradyrhizobium sp. LMTR 3]OCK59437.1 hypothetical protein LMTR3_17250 [Bradyrhizobium sp. LMTR 3]
MSFLMKARFSGGMAESHQLPAYEGAQSLYGISRSALITLNYLAEGRVRRRDFSPRGFQINLIESRRGSFEAIFEIITNPGMMTIVGSLGAYASAEFVEKFLASTVRRSVGEAADPTIEELEAIDSLNTGDTSALVDAIEPAMRSAHTVINHGAGAIELLTQRAELAALNAATKQYVWSSIPDDEIHEKLLGIASYNANSREGRAFDYELGKTIPFSISRDADRTTVAEILKSITSYALRREGDTLRSSVAVRYTRVLSADDRVKKIKILKARHELLDLNN